MNCNSHCSYIRLCCNKTDTITTQGSGYAVNDVLTISGSDIGKRKFKIHIDLDDFELLTTANALLPSTTGASATHNKGTYTGKTLSGGSGNGAIATVVTSLDSAVTSIALTTQGSGHVINDVLTISGSDMGRYADLKFTLVADDIDDSNNNGLLITDANALLPSTTGAIAHNKGTYTGKTLSGGSWQ